MTEALAPAPDDVDRMERALGWRPTAFRLAPVDRGPASRWIVSTDAGRGGRRSAFVKIGATPITAEWTRTEARNYAGLAGWFLPELLGFDDDGVRPALAIEDLSDADWPPPWSEDRVAAVLEALAAVHATPPPEGVGVQPFATWAGWPNVADDPEPFLALGLCSRGWLATALPRLIEAASAAPLSGDVLIHLDIRSDNLCFVDGRARMIDWNHASIANPDLDVAFWLASLEVEGGPPPESILPDAPGLAAFVSGFFCARAGLPPLTDAPHVRPLQIAQSRTALPWAARALGLAPPG